MLRGLFILLCCCWAGTAAADVLRVALFNAELHRKGPGLLLRDIATGEDVQVAAVADLLLQADADALLLLRFDWDADSAALAAFAGVLQARGLTYPHRVALRPNTGLDSGQDLDGDGLLRGPRDAQGYGLFSGQNGMALLSRLPIDETSIQNLSGLLWSDLPGAQLPVTSDGTPFPSAAAQAARRLSSVGHWDVPLVLPDGGRLHLLAFHASPPVFDGPEDANGLRNADELRLWQRYLDGALPMAPPTAPVVVIGSGNIDPMRGEGRRGAIRDLLDDPRLRDTLPLGDPKQNLPVAEATVDWQGITDPAHLRVDYVLPDAALRVLGSGILWPPPAARPDLLRHGLVWVDLALP
ncbi:MAG: endonuclease/exonuclease/phosphatase family protein [Pseudomonadota bacterium]